MDLFENRAQDQSVGPLANRLRPKDFSQFVGQEKVLGKNQQLIKSFAQGRLQSLILWGPPGTGKTSFAKALMNQVSAECYEENAIDLGTKRIRELGQLGKAHLYEQQKNTLLFVDEIHRLNRGQQDVLLPYVEKGYFYLIGATTENPSYQLNGALTSRCRLLIFEPHGQGALEQLMKNALAIEDIEREQLLSPESVDELLEASHGDARKLLNILEEIFHVYRNQQESFPIPKGGLEKVFASSGIRFDKKGDEHYDTISAFIKSIRGSDPDAGIYYLARMLAGGEDPVFIARRLVILASEDVGNADPNALSVAVNCLHAVELIGMPEAEITLAQGVTYLASAPKSNRSYLAIKKAKSVVLETGPLPVPKSLRSAKTKLMKAIGYGKDYKYAHDGERGWQAQEFFPEELKQRDYYEPSTHGFEKRIKEYLQWLRQKSEP